MPDIPNTPMIFNLDEVKLKAEQGNGLACYILGRSYDSGENGAEQNFQKAMEWYGKGQELGDARCIYGVGACYHFGDGVEQDQNKAKKLFIQAYNPLLELIEKDKDNPKKQAFSKFCLGAYYYFGFGNIEKDYNEAFKLIYDSAMQGHIAAIYDLGANFYYYGVGTQRDLKLSKYYLEIASNSGLPRAKTKLMQYKDVYESGVEK